MLHHKHKRSRILSCLQDEIYAEIKHHDSNRPGTSRSRKDQRKENISNPHLILKSWLYSFYFLAFYPYRNSVADQSITSDDYESSPSGSPTGVVPNVAAGLRKKSTPVRSINTVFFWWFFVKSQHQGENISSFIF